MKQIYTFQHIQMGASLVFEESGDCNLHKGKNIQEAKTIEIRT